MPTNLPPEYYKAEEQYKAATSATEKIVTLEELIRTVPKHKGTDKLRADLRRRLSKLKAAAQTKTKVGRHVSAFHIDKEGAAQAAVVGTSNLGKSALVTALTNASPEVADYPFTTWAPTPGMMDIGGAQIQLVDTPPLNRDYVEPALLDLIRGADLILLVVDLQTDPIGQLEEAIELLEKNRIAPCHLQDRYDEQCRYTCLPLLVVVNRNDDGRTDEDYQLFCELLGEEWPMIPVSATTGRNLEGLRRAVFEQLEIIRVFTKPPGEEPDLSTPYVLRRGSTVEEFAGKVHKDFLEGLKSARVWGSGAFEGQIIGRDHILQDGDVVELRL